MPATTTSGEQVLEAVVPGPDGANRLYTCTGTAGVSIGTVAGIQQQTQTWIFLVGPTLTRAQFHRTVATASVSNWNVVLDHPPPLSFQISINSVEADWDDESGKVEVRVEIHLGASGGPLMAVTQLRYWVVILAQI